MKDLSDRISVQNVVAPRRIQSEFLFSEAIDTSGFESLTIVFHIGEVGSSFIDFTGHYYILYLYHSDEPSTNFSIVNNNADVLDADVSSGNFKFIGSVGHGLSFLDPSSTGAVTRIGYRGSKRYLRTVISGQAINANNGVVFGVDAIKSHARHSQDNAFEIHNA